MPVSLGTTTVTALFLGTTSISSAYLGATQVFGGSFTPLALFSGGAQGIWLDPSDLSTMFSDRAGTTPVTAPGTVVGLRLDKSKGLALGSELVVNGTFDSGITSWTTGTTYSGTLSATGGLLTITTNSVNGFGSALQSVPLTLGKTYRLTGTRRAASGGNPAVGFGNSTGAIQSVLIAGSSSTTTNEFTASFVYTGNTLTLFNQTATNGAVSEFDNISVKELAGNHAQAPTDAARPIYGVEPKGGRRNLLTYSEDFRNTAGAGETRPWVHTNGTMPATQYLAPDGTTTAEKFTENSGSGNHSIARLGTGTNGTTYTYSVHLKYDGRRYVVVDMSDGLTGGCFVYADLVSGVISQAVTKTGSWTVVGATMVAVGSDGWYRVSVSGTLGANNTLNPCIWFSNAATGIENPSYTGNGTSGVYVWGAQLEVSSTVTPYQRVGTTTYDVTEAGVATCHYVQYDGSDDSMSTAAINFTATDKMSVFAGVNKLGTAAYSVFAELGIGGSSGGFVWHANGAGSSTVFLGNYTSPTAAAFFSDGGANQTYVGSVLLNRGGTSGALSEIAFRKNSVAISGTQDGSLSDSTGNYGNLAWFFGRRNNATLPFNGRDYGIVIVGKAASSTEITDTETWLAARTSGVTL